MTRTLVEFHGLLADHLINARRKHDGRPGPGQDGYLGDASADAVTAWRHFADVVSKYANGAEVVRGRRPTWEAFWADGMDREAFLRLVTDRSRITRALSEGGDMDTMLVDDSVRYWEYELSLLIMTKVDHLGAARRYQNAELAQKHKRSEAVRRIDLELEVSLAVARAYTGVDLATLRRTIKECGTIRPVYPGRNADGSRKWEPHLLSDLITANRPTF